MSDHPIEIPNVEILSATDATIRCRVGETVVDIARCHLRAGSEVAHAGDRGKLIVPHWLGVLSGMSRPTYQRDYGRF